jgi:hypothetical protein
MSCMSSRGGVSVRLTRQGSICDDMHPVGDAKVRFARNSVTVLISGLAHVKVPSESPL